MNTIQNVSGPGFFSGWKDLIDVVTGKETLRANELNAQLLAVNERKVQLQQLTRAQADAANVAVLADSPDAYRSAVGAAFLQGAGDGLAVEQEWFKRTLTNATTFSIKGVLGFIPWWVYLSAVIYVIYRLNDFDTSINKVRKKWTRNPQ